MKIDPVPYVLLKVARSRFAERDEACDSKEYDPPYGGVHFDPWRRGDLVIVQRISRSYALKGGTTESETWHVARRHTVPSAERQRLALTDTDPPVLGDAPTSSNGSLWRVATRYRDAAAKLIGQTFETRDHLERAIKDGYDLVDTSGSTKEVQVNPIERELQKATGVKPKPKEKRSAYLDRLSDEADRLDDVDFKKLSKDAEDWVNAASEEADRAKNQGREANIADFEEDEPEPKTSEDESKEDASGGETADETGEKDEDEVATKKGKRAAKSKNAAKEAKAKATASAAKKVKAAKANGRGVTKVKGFKKIGVTAEIQKFLQRKQGATIKEIMGHLTSKFPDRREEGMLITARASVYRMPTKLKLKMIKKDEDGRGLVYRMSS